MYILGTSATAHWGLLNLLYTLTGGTDWLDLEFGAMDKRQGIARNGVGMLQFMDTNAGHSFAGLPPLFCLLVIFGFLEMG